MGMAWVLLTLRLELNDHDETLNKYYPETDTDCQSHNVVFSSHLPRPFLSG